jgi:hypothetical protein
VSNRPFNAKKVKLPLALAEDVCRFTFVNPAASAMHDELMEIIFKAKEPKRPHIGVNEVCKLTEWMSAEQVGRFGMQQLKWEKCGE